MNHVFSAGMSSSQRAESAHSFFKDYVSDKNSLVEFMVQFNRGMLHKRHEELIVDHIDVNEKPRFKCPIKMEKQMSDIYTRKYYYKFQDQLWESYNYNLEVRSEDENKCTLKVTREDHEDGRARVIMYDKSKDFASCTCKLFESARVPCRHVLAYLHRIHQLYKLPDQYILKRWTKSAKFEVVMDKSGMEITVNKSLLEKRGLLFQQYSYVIDNVVLSEEASQLFQETMDSLIEKIKPLLANSNSDGVEPLSKKSSTQESTFREPDEVRTKGRAKRIKRGKEKSKGKRNGTGRHCHGCGKDGQTHDKRNCPVLLERLPSADTNENSSGDGTDDSYSSQDD
uniref:protein FAR-RED IMPAIRED RESPONSE 1-like n=1 Tax=Fragaria vesca subsp. vesca TaxID=101020 RepID=UPI0005CAEF7A|nr:PREDICTED: protein FAR-RED IMPAIRED RESPONSE 1-like [Fragaria vesca subsp. vesca]XP_011465787.1 PREDICTED: protein FAR-RED IMPAIRED RESPONSE 1-like [Fragaria vesca subsp. vesca]